MNLSFYIARRYLFSKKSHNAINLISSVAVCGVAVATTAMICAMSVFNGFQDLVSQMFCSFDPEIKITAVKGKVFDTGTDEIQKLKELPEIAIYTETLEDNVLLIYDERQVPATLKGVSTNYSQLTQIDQKLIDGTFKLSDEINNYGTLGVGLAARLGINAGFVYPMEICSPKRNSKVNLSNPAASLIREYVYIGGIFAINQPTYDDNLILVPIDLAKKIFDYEQQASGIELKLKANTNHQKAQEKIEQLLGDRYSVKNQYEQQEASFKMMNIEKWMTFLILCFILIIAVFNVIGSLSMLIIEKQRDVIMLRNMGANDTLISRIFLFEGWLISIIGAIAGIILGIIICLCQLQFGWLKMGDAGTFVVNAYPVKISGSDILFVFLTVMTVGFLAALYPVRYLTQKWLK